jgi:hypothetical protein
MKSASGSRKKAALANLSAEERAAVAEAFEAAEGWLEAMRQFFVDKLSEPNLRNVTVATLKPRTLAGGHSQRRPKPFLWLTLAPHGGQVMKQATALATGVGVPHKRYDRWFRKGEPVTLDEDMIALRAAANRFLLPEDDPGHGWCLDHPIGKMGIFQAYLHAKGKL